MRQLLVHACLCLMTWSSATGPDPTLPPDNFTSSATNKILGEPQRVLGERSENIGANPALGDTYAALALPLAPLGLLLKPIIYRSPEEILYGYTGAHLQLRPFLSRYSQNIESRTIGDIPIPYPSHFTQEFEELKFTCLGALLDAKVPASSGDKPLRSEREVQAVGHPVRDQAVRSDRWGFHDGHSHSRCACAGATVGQDGLGNQRANPQPGPVVPRRQIQHQLAVQAAKSAHAERAGGVKTTSSAPSRKLTSTTRPTRHSFSTSLPRFVVELGRRRLAFRFSRTSRRISTPARTRTLPIHPSS